MDAIAKENAEKAAKDNNKKRLYQRLMTMATSTIPKWNAELEECDSQAKLNALKKITPTSVHGRATSLIAERRKVYQDDGAQSPVDGRGRPREEVHEEVPWPF